MLPPLHENLDWRFGPMPRDGFPVNRESELRLGASWKWAVRKTPPPDEGRILMAFDARKKEYRVWQSRHAEDGWHLELRVEYHGHHPEWHAHGAGAGRSPLQGPVRPLAADRRIFLEDPRLWPESGIERARALLPFGTVSHTMLHRIEERLRRSLPECSFRSVPYGLAIGLPQQGPHGDFLGFYAGQLGTTGPLFRLEDDGATIPVLEAAGVLDPLQDPREGHVGRLLRSYDILYAPDDRVLFTPFFGLQEWEDRGAAFVGALMELWATLAIDETSRTHRLAPEAPALVAQ